MLFNRARDTGSESTEREQTAQEIEMDTNTNAKDFAIAFHANNTITAQTFGFTAGRRAKIDAIKGFNNVTYRKFWQGHAIITCTSFTAEGIARELALNVRKTTVPGYYFVDLCRPAGIRIVD